MSIQNQTSFEQEFRNTHADEVVEADQAVVSKRYVLHAPHELAELGTGPTGQRERHRKSTSFDELQSAHGIRNHCQPFAGQLKTIEPKELVGRQSQATQWLHDLGVTFTVYDNAEGTERIWPFDLLPRIVDADEWQSIEGGLEQRMRALNLFIGDVYDEQSILRDGVIPRELIESAPAFRRVLRGFRPPQDIWSHVGGVDLVRDEDGTVYVLEDNLRCPSGVSYALENRGLMKRFFADAFPGSSVSDVDAYPRELLKKLISSAPNPGGEAHVVLLSPGVYNSAYFEHTYLAQQMGVPLVYGSDLFVEDKFVYMQTTTGAVRVDVIYRRIDEDFLDSNFFRADSLIGVPGLMDAYLAGNVTLANAPGCGVADDKAVYAFVPKIIEYYLGEQPILSNVPTYICADPKQCDFVLSNLAELVVKPTNESGGTGVMIGPHCSTQQHDACANAIRQNPRGFIAQPMLNLSTVPTIVGQSLQPRHVDLRPFVLAGKDDIYVMPGGLTRVALPAGSMIVNSSKGGGSKDTWVLEKSKTPKTTSGEGFEESRSELLPKRVAFSLYWLHRYLERAENLACVLQEATSSDQVPAASWETLAGAFANLSDFRDRHDLPGGLNAIQWLAASVDNANSILSCLNSARKNAREIRNVLSDEVWLTLNTTYTRWKLAGGLSVDEVPEFLEQVIQLNVLVHDFGRISVAQDAVWHISRLGQMIERSDIITRLALTSLPGEYEAAERLLRTADDPHSLRYCLSAATESVYWLVGQRRGHTHKTRPLTQHRIELVNERLIRAMLKPEPQVDLRSVANELQNSLNELSNQIVSDFMTRTPLKARTTDRHISFESAESGLPANHLTITTASPIQR